MALGLGGFDGNTVKEAVLCLRSRRGASDGADEGGKKVCGRRDRRQELFTCLCNFNLSTICPITIKPLRSYNDLRALRRQRSERWSIEFSNSPLFRDTLSLYPTFAVPDPNLFL